MWKRNCPNCNTEISYSNRCNWNRGNRTNALCYNCANETRKGRKRTEEQRNLISEKTKMAMDNPVVIEKIKMGMSKPEVKQKMSENCKRQMNSMLKTEEDKQKWSEKISKGTKLKWVSRNEEDKQKILKTTVQARNHFIELLKNDDYKKEHIRKMICSGKTKDTKPELKVKTILESNGVKYEHPYQVDKKVFDFFIPEKNLLIEVDGIYWHSKNLTDGEMNEVQKKHKINDAVKNNLAKSLGYKLLRVWEDEINESDLTKRIYDL